MYPYYNTKIFTNIWDNAEDFVQELNESPFADSIKDDKAQKLYYLLYMKYGNSPIANDDEEQFKMKVFAIIFQYGPSWEKRLEIQQNLRNLSEEEITTGSKIINNHSYNPSTYPSTSNREELDTINEQSAQIQKRSKIDAYSMLWDLIQTDVTGEFIKRFEICFKKFVAPEHILLYGSEEE